MDLKIEDFNDPNVVLSTSHATEWKQVLAALEGMPLHLKASDQEGRQGSLIFDPVGTNAYLKATLGKSRWFAAKIEPEYDFLGIDVDYAKSGVILEAQFSNYPFLLNNLLRSELFFREKVRFDGAAMSAAVIVVKAAMFPASNSTLYYEQALKQLKGLAKFGLFKVPLRLVGLFSPLGHGVAANFTSYAAPRYSRTVSVTTKIKCNITAGGGERCRIVQGS